MNETFIKFTDVNVDGCGTDVTNIAKITGDRLLTEEDTKKVAYAINTYKNTYAGEWDTDGCLDAAKEELERQGFKVEFVNPVCNLCF